MDNKLFKYILIGLLGLSAILSVLFMFDIVSEGLLITWCYVLLAIASLSAIIFPLITMAQNPKGAKNALIGVVGLIVIVGISYFLSGSEVYNDLDGNILADAATSKKSEAGLIAFYILGAGAIGSIIYAEVSKMFK